MNKEELYIITDGSRVQLDLPSPSGITLKWVSNLFSDISKLTCSYSYTFKLPMTSNNRRSLQLADDIRHDVSMMKKSFRAEFIVNGICLCPNANLYVSELSDSFQCVMTWKVLKAFESLKNDSIKLNELPSLGKIVWGGSEVYGGNDSSTSNMDAVVYPDYDAGVPHMKNTPPKPCVPVYRLIQMINEKYGVKFNIGQKIESGMGLKPRRYLNNSKYYGFRVYDDFVSNGVIPLTNSQVNNDRFTVRSLFSIGSHTMLYKYLQFVENWQMAVIGTGSSSNPIYTKFYKVTEGTYTNIGEVVSDQLNATYMAPDVLAIGIPLLSSFSGNEYVKPLYAYQHNTGLFFFNAKKSQKADVDHYINYGGKYLRWATRKYEGIERIEDELNTSKPKSWGGVYNVKCTEDTTGVHAYSYDQGVDGGKDVGIVGFYTRNSFALKGACELHISKTAVTEGRIDPYNYMWICLAAVNVTKKEDSEEYEFSFDPVTEKSINSSAGFQSKDKPSYDEETNSYICHFEFGSEYDVRKIEVDTNEDENFKGYVLLPYFPEDYMNDIEITDEDGNTDTIQKLNLKEGDFVIENLVITEIIPNVDASVLPATLRITESLPSISCFDFMKSVFYMNGAMPRVERDGETISAMYYNQLRDRVNDGEVLDWSCKLLSSDRDMANSLKIHNTKFAKNNYFEMSNSQRGKTEDEVLDDFDQYNSGYGNISIDDDTLNDETSVFKSSFNSAYIQNLRYPLIKVGNTCKIWEGDNIMEDNVPAIYGYMVFRTLDSMYEDTSVNRPQNGDISIPHKRMNIFSPFDKDVLMENFFGYLGVILNDYQLIKEKFVLNEIDLRDFNESMPVYLSKYNSYFAVSTIQRDKEGISTVELVKLPRSVDSNESINMSYEVEMLSSDYVMFNTGSDTASKVLFKSTKDGDWQQMTADRVMYGDDSIYAITAENLAGDIYTMFLYAQCVGKYRFTYEDADTGEKRSIIRSEAHIYFDGVLWADGSSSKSIEVSSNDWHRVEFIIPIRNQYDEVVETRRWYSPLFVSRKELADYGEDDVRIEVQIGSVTNFTLDLLRSYTSNRCPIVYEGGQTTYNTWSPKTDGEKPRYAYPYEASCLSGDSYTLGYTVSNSISYTVIKRKGYSTLSKENLSTKLRTYYDDVRVIENGTLTFLKTEFGQYHAFKFIADLVDGGGTIVKKLRYRLLWFVSEKQDSVLDEPFGDEHNGDSTVKVTAINVTGSTTIADKDAHRYTLSYSPAYADVKVSSVQVLIFSTAESIPLKVQDVSVEGFSLVASSLPQDEEIYNVSIKATLEDGSIITKSVSVSLVSPSITLVQVGNSSTLDFEAINGNGTSGAYRVVLRPQNVYIAFESINSSNADFTIERTSDDTEFRLSVADIQTDATTTVQVTVRYGTVIYTKTFTITAKYVDAYSVDVLDKNGVMIVDRNGRFYTKDEWVASGNESDDADGIGVSDGTHRLLISKTHYESSKGAGYGTTISGIVTTTDEATALADFSGKANTDLMVAALTDSAASEVRSKNLFVSGKNGYIGSLGEWSIIAGKRSTINTLMNLIGAQELFYKDVSCDYMSSTHASANNMWVAHFGAYIEYQAYSKNSNCWVRALAEIPETATVVKVGYISIDCEDEYEITNGTGSVIIDISYGPTDVTISEVSMESSNPDIVVTKVSDTQLKLSVSNMLVDEITTIYVRARLNGIIKKASKTITFIGNTVVDYAKLDSEHALILDKEYNLYTEEEWYASKKLTSDVEGIAVSDGTHRIIVSIYCLSVYKWGGRSKDIPGLSTNTSLYNGYDNTESIIAAVTSSDGYFTASPYSAAAVAKNNPFPSGEIGFLGSAAEWGIVAKYAELVESLITAVNGDALIKTGSFTYWTSTGGSSNTVAYTYHMYRSSTDNSLQTGTGSSARSDSRHIRVFRNF